MINSYDSVTQKRRPVIRVTLATLAVMMIFGASVSAATISQAEVATTLAPDATSSDPSAAILDDNDDNEDEEPQALLEDVLAEDDSIDFFALEQANAVARTRILEIESLASGTDFGELIGSVNLDGGAISGSLADALDGAVENTDIDVEVLGSTNEAPEQETDRLDIAAIVDERDTAVAELEAQSLAVRDAQAEAQATANLSAGERAVVLSNELGSPASESAAQAAWDAGYALGGGSNLSSFHNTILPCESGNQANRDTVVGRTDDWGRAQVNRPVWRTTFESLTGVVFEEGIVQPVLNGYMAAYIEDVQGLTAWTCWRNR